MNALELRRRTLGKGVYKKTVEGNPAIAQGSLARRYPGITMQGWTEQARYEGNQLFDASKISTKSEGGANVTNNGDGSFTISGEGKLSGTYSNSITIPYESFFGIKEGPLSLLCDRTNPYFFFQLLNENGEVIVNLVSNNNTAEITQDIAQSIKKVIMGFYGPAGEDIEPGTIKPMVYQSGNGTWEPYTGGAPSPSPDYPQEIVSAGKYDEGTGKYQYTIKISDSEESPTKSQTITLTSDRPLTKWDKLTKKNGVWGWEYGSAEIVFDGSEAWVLTGTTSDEYQGFALKSSAYNAMKSNLRLVCDKFAYSTSDKINTCRQEKSEHGLRFVVSTEYVPNKTVAEFKNWLQSNPITVLYRLAEPVFVPLSASEQEQMNALHTFRPTTVLSNDCDCNMSLTYKTKKSMQSAPGGYPES